MTILEGNLTVVIRIRNVHILWSGASRSDFSPRVTFTLAHKEMYVRIFSVVLFVIKVVEQYPQCGTIGNSDQKGLVLLHNF